jgi:hypothetical protein
MFLKLLYDREDSLHGSEDETFEISFGQILEQNVKDIKPGTVFINRVVCNIGFTNSLIPE